MTGKDQPNIEDGFSTQIDPRRPQERRVGVDMRDKHELSNKFLGEFLFLRWKKVISGSLENSGETQF